MQPTSPHPKRPPTRDPAGSILSGHCLCGAVRITVAGRHEPRIGACHCRMCQRWTGGLFLCFSADAAAVNVEGEVTRYRSSSFAERAFCPRCGSHLWFNDVEDGGQASHYELMPGLFDAAHDWPLRSEIYVDRAMAAVRLLGEHRRRSRAEYEAENPFVDSDTGAPAEVDAAEDSPNRAERLQSQGLASTPGDGRGDNLFESTSADSPYARDPGLPDFTRGA